MAWHHIIHSIMKAARILRLDITEQDLPDYDDYKGLVALDRKLWWLVSKQKKAKTKAESVKQKGG